MLAMKRRWSSSREGMPGMITGILRGKEHEKARGVNAGDLVTRPAIIVTPGDTVAHAARLMYTPLARDRLGYLPEG
jgi:hypothetical protein